MNNDRTRPYLVVSADSHAGPALVRQLRPYCPSRHLDAFDEYAAAQARQSAPATDEANLSAEEVQSRRRQGGLHASAAVTEAFANLRKCAGLQDPYARLRDMDADGIAADVIFAGGQNGEVLPFMGFGLDGGSVDVDAELRALGAHIWNQWLSDFVSVEPDRFVGVVQIPIHDVAAAVREVEWAAQAGLKAVNIPAPRRDFPPYTDPSFEPLWDICVESGVPLVCHSGGGETALGTEGPMGWALYHSESHWLSRRGLWQLIFGGVFDRHPSLKLVFTEGRVAWVPETLRDLDSIYLSEVFPDVRQALPRRPSDYWRENCYVAGSFLARFEVAMRDEVGPKNLLWGSDYPHVEGTWPRTKLAMRNTLWDVPVDDVRKILGENALAVYPLNADALADVAFRIGPTPTEIAQPVPEDELPAFRGFAFREVGNMA
jgi:predicted TIM-barrel fold metal-dependent hydrolase